MKMLTFPLLHAAVLAAALAMPSAGAFAQAMSADNTANPSLMDQVQVVGSGNTTTGGGQVVLPVMLPTLQGLPMQGDAAVIQPAQPATERESVPGTVAPPRTMCLPVPGPGVG